MGGGLVAGLSARLGFPGYADGGLVGAPAEFAPSPEGIARGLAALRRRPAPGAAA